MIFKIIYIDLKSLPKDLIPLNDTSGKALLFPLNDIRSLILKDLNDLKSKTKNLRGLK